MCRYLVQLGYGDLKVVVENRQVLTIKNIMCSGNSTIKKLVDDPSFTGILMLYEGSTLSGFMALEEYYGCGKVYINEENIIDLLCMSVYYYDKMLINLCKKYIKSHLNGKIISKLLNRIEVLQFNQLNELDDICEEYLNIHGYKLLNKGIFHIYMYIDNLKYLSLRSIEYIMKMPSLYILNENVLLNCLLEHYRSIREGDYYNTNIDYRNSINDDMNEILKLIHYEKIDIEKISEDNRKILKEFSDVNNLMLLVQKKHIIIPLPPLTNAIRDVMIKYYMKTDLFSQIEEEDLKMIESIKFYKTEIEMLLEVDDTKVILITLVLMIDKKVDYDIKNYLKILYRLIAEYLNVRNNKQLVVFKNCLVKCLCLFINLENIKHLHMVCGMRVLFEILNNNIFLNYESESLIINYIIDENIGKEENDLIDEIILNNRIARQIKSIYFYYNNIKIVKPLNTIKYNSSSYIFTIYEEVDIKCKCDGTSCYFSISPSIYCKTFYIILIELPNGLKLNEKTGAIVGRSYQVCKDEVYVITCENIFNKIESEILLTIEDVQFINECKHDNIIISNNRRTIKHKNDSGWYHCYLNITMVDGVHHLVFRESGNEDCYTIYGATTNNDYQGTKLYEESSTCCFYISSNGSGLSGLNGTQLQEPNKQYENGNETYELVFDMNRKIFSIKYDDGIEEKLFENITGPLYPFVIDVLKTSITIIAYWIE